MKRVLKAFLILFIVFQTAFLYADDIKVLVSPFSGPEEDANLIKKTAIITAKEVEESKGFAYVSPSYFANTMAAWARGESGAELSKPGIVDLDKEYGPGAEKRLEEMAKVQKKQDLEPNMGLLVKTFNTANVSIDGKVKRKGNLVRVELTVTPTFVLFSSEPTVIECSEDRLDGELRKTVKGLLNKLLKPELENEVKHVEGN